MGKFEKEINEFSDKSKTEERLIVIRQERDRLKSQLELSYKELDELKHLLKFHDVIGSADQNPPKWMQPKKSKNGHKAVACSILSDCHFDEVVRPEEIGFINKYNRDIATLRLKKWAEGFIEQSRDYLTGIEFEGAVVALGGDLLSGDIHSELKETNEDTLFGSMLYWSEQICAALELVAEHFGNLHVPCVVGNHGRLTHKPRMKLRARENTDWFLAHMVRRHFESNKNVTVTVTDDADCFFTVFSTTHLLTHGDQVKGGNGIGGIWPPIMRMIARKRTRYSATPFDVCVMGHWHSLIMSPSQGIIVNGATKGYDEFASIMNFAPERPQQAMWICTPENKITWTGPIFCDDRRAEKW